MKDVRLVLFVTLVAAGCTRPALVKGTTPPVAELAPARESAGSGGEVRPDPVSAPSSAPPRDESRFRALTAELKQVARRVPGRGIALWVEDRLGSRRWALNGDQVMRSASLIKIPVAAVALAGWERAPERRTPAIQRRVWRTLAESHNVSTDVVVDHVGGLFRINRFCRQQGWSRTRMSHKMMAWRTRKAHNVTTARDVAAMLRAIDTGELVSPGVSEGLWRLLRDQQIVDRIPAGLPKGAGVEVGNKTGTMLSVIHDAGIVRGDGVRYLLVVMINGPRSEAAADAFCRRISARVYRALAPSGASGTSGIAN